MAQKAHEEALARHIREHAEVFVSSLNEANRLFVHVIKTRPERATHGLRTHRWAIRRLLEILQPEADILSFSDIETDPDIPLQ